MITTIAHSILGILSFGTLAALIAVSTVTDVRTKKIPNWATYTALLFAIAINLAASACGAAGGDTAIWNVTVPVGIQQSLWGAAICFAAMFLLYAVSGTGAGDVKLATAVGALAGAEVGISVILWGYVIAGAVGLVWAVWKIGPLKFVHIVVKRVGSLLLPVYIAPPDRDGFQLLSARVPMAGFFAAGTVLTLLGVSLI
jgi:prepilin peptidase CpaA